MGSPLPKFSSFIFSISVIFLLISCNQNLPEVRYASACVVFDYSENQEIPDTRFGIYVETQSNVRRVQKITAANEKSQFSWECYKPILIQSGNTQWACGTDFCVPSGEKIPKGKYSLVFEDSNSEETSTYFSINYDEDFYNKKAEEIPGFMNKKNGTKSILIFDKQNQLLYYGPRTPDLNDDRAIWNRYRNAGSYKEVWSTQDQSVACIMPAVLITFEINN